MKLWNNPEVKRHALLQMGMTAGWTIAGAFCSPWAAALIAAAGISLMAVQYVFTRARYRRIAQLSQGLNRVLHGAGELAIAECQEGELSILASEIQKMTQSLLETSDQLRREKNRLSDAMADIFHQLRTPLTSMNLMVTLLSREELSYPRRLELARMLREQLERTQWLVEALLKMSRIDAGAVSFRRESVDVSDMLRQAAEPLRIPMELRGQNLILPETEANFQGDKNWTAEAMGNLLKNAMEHTPEGGRIVVSAEETALFTQITVTDSGEGFAPEDIPNLFERFYKGKNAAPTSIGIGLALSRMILSAQDAVITAKNAPEGGAEFTVKFYKTVV